MITIHQHLARMRFAPFAAAIFAVAAAILMAAVPTAMLETMVATTGLPHALNVAQPPLGIKARVIAIIVAFAAVGVLAWLASVPVERMLDRDGRRRPTKSQKSRAGADADEPPVQARRRPILAANELGAPLMSAAALAGLAPFAERVSDRVTVAPGDSFDAATREGQRPPPLAMDAQRPSEPLQPTQAVEGDTSIRALIRRLEARLARFGDSDPDPDTPDVAPLALEDEWIVNDLPRRQPPPGDDDDDFGPALATLKRYASR